MVAIRPFRALRYDPAVAGDVSRVIAPPYDVIDPEGQERLYDASPYNIVRLILGKQYPDDTEAANRYTRAREAFETWCARGVLRRDSAPAYYLIEHTFSDEGRARSRLGFIALLQFDEAATRGVYRHEATLAAPKADRTKLLEAVPANLSPVFCVYPDDGAVIQTVLQGLTTRLTPSVSALYGSERIRVWIVTDPAAFQAVVGHLGSVSVLIADGHHRFEVAFTHRARYGAVMTYFVSMADPSLVMRPIHRVVQSQRRVDEQALRKLCVIERAPDVASLTRWLEGGEGHGRFGFYDGRALYTACVQPDQLAEWLKAPTVPPTLAQLDVSLLHGLILPRLGVNGRGVRYISQVSEAVGAVDRGEGAFAWLLRRIPLTEVYSLAAQGLTLPPKSTYFYPKVLSGLTINPLTEPPAN